MEKAMSMLELNEVAEIRGLDDAGSTDVLPPLLQMQTRSEAHLIHAVPSGDSSDSSGNGFFIGDDDDSIEHYLDRLEESSASAKVRVFYPSEREQEEAREKLEEYVEERRQRPSSSSLSALHAGEASWVPLDTYAESQGVWGIELDRSLYREALEGCAGLRGSVEESRGAPPTPLSLTSHSTLSRRKSEAFISMPRPSSLKRSESKNSVNRNISFSSIEIREYSITLGDHPNCSYGPPVSLGWEYNDVGTVDMEKYDASKMSSSTQSKKRMVRTLSWNQRQELLKMKGFTQIEIDASMKEVERMKMKRSVTKALKVTGRTEEALESAGRKLKRFMGREKSGN
eukprot:CAMPEP_0113582972 /NCGR_PEP_ID=MMETSP0015_2-20120614/32233_1 /TAXON_ID=2838 /ORGANISM="Odontella" /LENGTH=341 /DNA_ID=CAMNT_0000487747 /DNA_START=49 /DNA_END=1074 /DNA_ORIENTATION=+ /assembly_acc=CAM_ASM_000160